MEGEAGIDFAFGSGHPGGIDVHHAFIVSSWQLPVCRLDRHHFIDPLVCNFPVIPILHRSPVLLFWK
jgi:hypothetical protein